MLVSYISMKDVSLIPYIQRCLQKVHPDLKLSAELAARLNKRLNRLARALVRGAIQNCESANRKTLLHVDIQNSLFKILTDAEMCGRLVHHAAKAMAALESSAIASKEKQARSRRAGLLVSVSRATSFLRSATTLRVSESSAVCLASVLEGVVCEVFKFAGDLCLEDHRKVVLLKHFEKAIEDSSTLREVF